MLFNSYVFIFLFLPIALAGFFFSVRMGEQFARGPLLGACWLIGVSFVFYAWWRPSYVLLLAASIAANYLTSRLIACTEDRPTFQNAVLIFGIGANLLALAHFKYLSAIVDFFTHHNLIVAEHVDIALPLGISFFTFTQIGYLIDCKQGMAKNRGILNYLLFVTFFPHLIAGPLLHNREMMPQFSKPDMFRPCWTNIAAGTVIFAIGLLKKTILADVSGITVDAGFAKPEDLQFFSAWQVILLYSLQIYFDFSGYSDMAIGLARMFNVRFPQNFNSPYKSTSIIEYWQRWHMTLTRYLTLYLYNPLALTIVRRRMRLKAERGLARPRKTSPSEFCATVFFPTFITMSIAGIWHGAGLQYLIFGMLHGLFITVNHAWRLIFPPPSQAAASSSRSHFVAKILLTYGCVILALVFFRSQSSSEAMIILASAAGSHGVETIPVLGALTGQSLHTDKNWTGNEFSDGVDVLKSMLWLAILYTIVWRFPNTQQIMRFYHPVIEEVHAGRPDWLVWRPNLVTAILLGVGIAVGILSLGGTTTFVYFQF